MGRADDALAGRAARGGARRDGAETDAATGPSASDIVRDGALGYG